MRNIFLLMRHVKNTRTESIVVEEVHPIETNEQCRIRKAFLTYKKITPSWSQIERVEKILQNKDVLLQLAINHAIALES